MELLVSGAATVALLVLLAAMVKASVQEHCALADRVDLLAFQLRSLTEDYHAFLVQVHDAADQWRVADESCDCELCRPGPISAPPSVALN